MSDRTFSLPPCRPDHPWQTIPTADLARGVCPRCGSLLDGKKCARIILARIWDRPIFEDDA